MFGKYLGYLFNENNITRTAYSYIFAYCVTLYWNILQSAQKESKDNLYSYTLSPDSGNWLQTLNTLYMQP